MKIFLTGGTGFLGKAITQFLKQHQYFLYKRGDDIKSCLDAFSPDVIIHSAGEIYKEELMISSNILLTYSILEYLKQHNTIKMLYFGSSSEYGKKQTAMKETDCCDPQNMYAATKIAGTVLCQAYARTYDCDVCIIRPFSVYGDYEPDHRLIPTLYRKITANETINLIQGTHDFIYIVDFVELVNKIICSSKSLTQANIVNGGTGICYTNVEVAETFARVLNKPVHYNLTNQYKLCDSPIWVCDGNFSKSQYGFSAKYTLETGLVSYKYHICSHMLH